MTPWDIIGYRLKAIATQQSQMQAQLDRIEALLNGSTADLQSQIDAIDKLTANEQAKTDKLNAAVKSNS